VEQTLTFKDQTELVISKSQRKLVHQPRAKEDAASNCLSIYPISVDISQRATTYFLYHYVSAASQQSCASWRGNHEYLPKLLGDSGPYAEPRSNEACKALSDIAIAAGLASLANAGNSKCWMDEAYRSYNRAIRNIQLALNDPEQCTYDATLATVMLMGTFEVIMRL
jgi:Fungal specific transcription factor domain